MRKEIFYITYDGVLENIGDSQIKSYLIHLSLNFNINLLSFEKEIDLNNKKKYFKLKNQFNNIGINWFHFKYHNKPKILSTIYDIFVGVIFLLKFFFKRKKYIFHVRSYIPGVICLLLLYFFKFELIFDMRGFWVDEKVERIGWKKNSLIYFFFKKIEKKLIYNSNNIICLTNHSKEIILMNFSKINSSKFTIIPTCVDTKVFIPEKKRKNDKYLTFGYLGSYDGAYDIRKVLKLFCYLLNKKQKVYLKIYTKDINQKLKKIISEEFLIPFSSYKINYVERDSIVNEINQIDICIFYANNNFSIKGSFPTKIGEFLSCGKPIICNDFNEDISNIIKNNNLGNIIDFTEKDYEKLIIFLKDYSMNKKLYQEKCRNFALEELSIEKGVKMIQSIYNRVK